MAAEAVPWSARTVDPYRDWVRLADVPEPKYPPFVIENVAHDENTIIYGRPEAGKSYLMLTMAESLMTGEPWMGRKIRERRRVAFWMLDPAQVNQTKRRVGKLGGSLADMLICARKPGQDEKEWEREAQRLADIGIDFLFIDNLFRLMPRGQSVRNDDAVNGVLENIQVMESKHIAVMLCHHLGKPGEGGSTPESPLGSTVVEGWARHLVRVEHDKKTDERALVSYGNDLEVPPVRIGFEISEGGTESTELRDEARDRERLERIQRRSWANQAEIGEDLGIDQGQVSRLLARLGHKRDRRSGLIVPVNAAA